MKKLIFIITSLFLFSCGEEVVQNNCFPTVSVNESLNLSNPEFINLQLEAANVSTTLPQSKRRIIIIKRSSSNIKVFDLQSPNKDCKSPMTFDGLKLKCPCDNNEYSSLNGSPINGEGCFALEYNVQTSGATLRITR